MNEPLRRPPLALRIATRLLPSRFQDEVLGDLVEAWHTRHRSRGLLARTAWSWSQPLVAIRLRLEYGHGWHSRSQGRGMMGLLGEASSLDLKLGLRMLRKHPGITIISVSSMAMAVAFTAGFTAFSANVFNPRLPLDEGDRIVAIQVWDRAGRAPEPRILHEYESWRSELTSIPELGAFKPNTLNMMLDGGRSVSIRGAEVTASTFGITRALPLHGRVLVPDDDRPGAPPVAVVGFDLWESAFGGAEDLIGQSVRLGETPHEIVGVMPEGFRFPFAEDLWVPLRENAANWNMHEGPALFVFGRLGDGVTLAESQAELTTRWRRALAEKPASYETLFPRVLPYTASFGAAPASSVFKGQIFFALILILACVNVGTLLAVRNSTRSTELTIRAALGAGRRRIAVQLFVETLVLAAVAMAVGLALTAYGLGQLEPLVGDHFFRVGVPFWWRGGLAPSTIAYVVLASCFGAVIVGALPALRATPGSLNPRLQHSSGGLGGASMRSLGWAIPVQVAVSIAAMALVIGQAPYSLTREIDIPGLASTEYLTAELRMGAGVEFSSDPVTFLDRYADARSDLADRLARSPGVEAVSFTSALPGTPHRQQRVEVEDQREDIRLLPVRVAHVDPDFFRTMRIDPIAGRSFGSGDVGEDGSAPPVVVINASLALSRVGTTQAVGRRLRLLSSDGDPGAWLEVVGVVPDFAMNLEETSHPEGFYRPLTRSAYPVSLAARVGPDAMRRASDLRAAAIAADPGLSPREVRTMESIIVAARLEKRLVFFGVALPTFVALLLALSGINALVSLAVTRRTPEMGIRIALGAHPARVAYEVVVSTLAYVAVGVVAGFVVTVFLSQIIYPAQGLLLVAAAGVVVISTGALACASPIRRALAIQPSMAFRTTQ